MPGIGFMNYRRRAAVAPGQKYGRKVVRVRFNKATGAGKVTGSRYTTPRKGLVQAVRSILARQEETKEVGLDVETATPHNAAISAADIVPILPGLSSGTTANNRIGDKIRPTKLHLNGVLSYNDIGQGYIGAPLTVKVFVLQAKSIRDSNQVSNAPVSKLMKSTGLTNWDGSTQHSLYQLNTDDFQILGTRTVKVASVTAETSKGLSKRWSMDISCPAMLQYSVGGLYPTNFAPFVVVGWCRDDGTTPNIGQTWVISSMFSKLYFKDA